MKYLISTLGCKVNQYETQAMETILLSRGHRPAAPGETADAVIVNTCAVTAESGRKSRQLIRRLQEENPGAVVGVCGCYSQLSPEEAAEDYPYTAQDLGSTLLAEEPYDDLYTWWLQAQVDLANGEYDRAQNTMAMFNALWTQFVCWYCQRYDPVQEGET